MPKLKWFTWSSVLGAGIGSWGLVWLLIWSYLAQDDGRIFWLTSDLHSPMAARLMVCVGAGLFVLGTSAGLLLRLRKSV